MAHRHLLQLEGSALAGCRDRVECPECGGGFCLTRLPEALEACEHDCFDGEVPGEAFCLTGGAGTGLGWLTIRCRSDDAIAVGTSLTRPARPSHDPARFVGSRRSAV